MAGHSKWANIKHRKGAQDAKRGKIFQKVSKELYVAAKQGGTDPQENPALRLVISKARAANMAKDTIQKAIDKAKGGNTGEVFEELVYEGYAQGGVAIMVATLTDNRNRTGANVRSIFTKRGGNLGTDGSVNYMFDRTALFRFEDNGFDEEELTLNLLDFDVEEINLEEGVWMVTAQPKDFENVKKAIEDFGVEEFLTAEILQHPNTTVEVDEATAEKVMNLIEAMEDDDDVQSVYHNMA